MEYEMSNVVREKSFRFAVESVQLYKELIKQNEYVLSKQFLRSATSIGVNVEEEQSAESKKDFLSKMSISLKEARETRYWLLLMHESKLITFDLQTYLQKSEELIKLLTSITKSAKASIPNKKGTQQ